MSKLESWWHRPDHYDWLSAHIADSNLEVFMRVAMGTLTAMLGVIPPALAWGVAPPPTPARLVVAICVSVTCGVLALMWFLRWPTRRQAVLYVVLACLCIAAACLIETERVGALVGCSTFAVLGGYIALFLPFRFSAANLVVALVVTAIIGVDVARDGAVVLAVCKGGLVLVILVAGFVCIQILVDLLDADVSHANFDPLTGLLNRRSLYRFTVELVATAHDSQSDCLVAILVDIDSFKSLNDREGHAAGDRALGVVATTLRLHCGESAVVARIGGEEFVAVDLVQRGGGYALAERLRVAIAAAPCRSTVSVGVTETALSDLSEGISRELLDGLVEDADSAMYEAKRAGGNRVHRGSSRYTGNAAQDGHPHPVTPT